MNFGLLTVLLYIILAEVPQGHTKVLAVHGISRLITPDHLQSWDLSCAGDLYMGQQEDLLPSRGWETALFERQSYPVQLQANCMSPETSIVQRSSRYTPAAREQGRIQTCSARRHRGLRRRSASRRALGGIHTSV